METGSITTAAEAFSSTVAAQQAFNVIGLLSLLDGINPYDGCVKNTSIFDYIIIGGGTSGSVLGNRLSEQSGVNVLVIEAGGSTQLENALPNLVLYTKRSRFDWNYTAAPDGNFVKCHQSSEYEPTIGKVLGGSSSVDSMVYSQGEDRDYDKWAELSGETSWRFENVQELFKKVERFNDEQLRNSPDRVYHGFNGKVGLTKDHSTINNKYLEAFRAIGYDVVGDINAKKRLGFTGTPFYIDGGLRQNSAYAYLYPVRNRTNLVVLKNTQVTKILFDDQKNAIGVEAVGLKNNLKYVLYVRREIVLAAGVFNTPKLLQLSGIGPRDLLEPLGIPVIVNSPSVGANYHNHLGITIVYATEKISKKCDVSKQDPHKFPAPTFIGSVSLNKSDTYADYQSISFVIPYSPAVIELQYEAFIFRYGLNIADHWNTRSAGREMLVTILKNTKPKSRGTVEINSSNPFHAPTIKTGFLSNDGDVTDFIRYAQDFSRVVQSPYFKEVEAIFVDPSESCCGRMPAGSDEYWRCYVSCFMAPLSDHVGTAALGPVVGGRLRVHGVHNLRVADASIIPEILAGSVTVATMMIGENCANLIKADWL